MKDSENHESIPENSRNPETSQDFPSQNSPGSPENNPEIDAQDTEVINIRGEKYNSRPNPNPNYSDSYRYKRTNQETPKTLTKYNSHSSFLVSFHSFSFH